jgi:hypothetical protein
MRKRRTSLLRRLALGLAVAALVAPAAQARSDEGGTQARGSGYVPFVTDFPKQSVETYVPFLTDFPQPSAAPTDAGVPVGVPDPGPQPAPVAAEPGGFSWGDGLIGFSVGLGIVLLALGAVVATRHLGRPATAA